MTSLPEFLAEFSSTDDFEQWTWDVTKFATFMDHVHKLATSPDEFASSLSSQFIWNLQYAVGELVWDRRIADPDRLNLLRDTAVVATAMASSDTYPPSRRTSGLLQFWESVVEVGDRPEKRDDQVIRSALFECFTNLLENPHPLVQSMALHGLHHLHHPTTAEVIEALNNVANAEDRE